MKRLVPNVSKILAGSAALLLLGACSFGSGDPAATGGNDARGDATSGDVTFATPTPNWILPISAPGKTQGENALFIDLMYPGVFAYALDADRQRLQHRRETLSLRDPRGL